MQQQEPTDRGPARPVPASGHSFPRRPAAAGRLAGAGLLVLPVLLSGCSQLELMNPRAPSASRRKG